MGLVQGSHTRLLTLPGDQSLITMATAEDQQKKSEMNDQLREYISQWRDERAKEEAELKRLKDKQAARKEIRAEQDRELAAKKKEEEDQRKKAEAAKKAAEEEEKKKAMEEAEIKRQEMMAAQKGEARSPLVRRWTLARRCPRPR